MGEGHQGLRQSVAMVYQFQTGAPHIPAELIHELVNGHALIEIDEKLFYHFKFRFRQKVFYDTPVRFGLSVGLEPWQIAEFFIDAERYYVRPARFLDN